MLRTQSITRLSATLSVTAVDAGGLSTDEKATFRLRR